MTRARTVTLLTPVAAGPTGGNRVTAERWAQHFQALGFEVSITDAWDATHHGSHDALVALHAEKTLDGVRDARVHDPALPVVVACAGTDLYGDGQPSLATLSALAIADRVVVLQPDALQRLPPDVAERTRVVYQSVEPIVENSTPDDDVFEVCVLAHLRSIKDPLLPARAARLLPPSSRVLVRLLGDVIEPALGAKAEAEARDNPRFVWEGARPREEALQVLARSRLLVSPSRHEGGSNAVREALAHGVAVLATAIPGTLGLLGPEHVGTFPTGDASTLASLMSRAETDSTFFETLAAASRARAWITEPARERSAWKELLDGLFERDTARGAAAEEESR